MPGSCDSTLEVIPIKWVLTSFGPHIGALIAGLVHYQQNLDCFTATYTISYNNEDPGTQAGCST